MPGKESWQMKIGVSRREGEGDVEREWEFWRDVYVDGKALRIRERRERL
jgi:hypothetical protein